MITGFVQLDLREEDRDNVALSGIAGVPDGATVGLEIGHRTFVSQRTAHFLAEHAERLHLDVRGTTADAVSAWVEALRTEARGWGGAL